jgi:hypothetical protein
VRGGFNVVTSNSDAVGVAARDKTAYMQSAQLACEDPASWATLIALYEASSAAAGLTVTCDGKISNTANAGHFEIGHTKLVGASLNFEQGSYCRTTLDLRTSVAAASSAAKDEFTYTAPGALTVTHSTALRGYRITAAEFVSTSTVTPLGVESLSVDVRGQGKAVYGDAEFGEVFEVSGYDVTGSLRYRDATLTTLAMTPQTLMGLGAGYLDITWQQANSDTAKVLRIANVIFEADDFGMRTRDFHSNSIAFGCFMQNGTNFYDLATNASYKIFTIDPA